MEGRSPFPPSRWQTERLNEKTTDPVFIVILGCEKHVQLLICVYLSVLCDVMLFALLSSIVTRVGIRDWEGKQSGIRDFNSNVTSP